MNTSQCPATVEVGRTSHVMVIVRTGEVYSTWISSGRRIVAAVVITVAVHWITDIAVSSTSIIVITSILSPDSRKA